MEQRKKDVLLVTVMALMLAVITGCVWFGRPRDYSDSERRVLAQWPELTAESLLSGAFMDKFEGYAQDQFPFRDSFRSLKAMTELGVFAKMDNNQLYVSQGHLSKLEYPLRENMLDHAARRFSWIYETYLKDSGAKVYFSIVPDKNYFLAQDRLTLDYAGLAELMRTKTSYMEYVDIWPALEQEDYYRTDTHWRQERLGDVASILAEAMGVELKADYLINELDTPFYGVYTGQAALPVIPDTIYYLTNEILENCRVTSYDTGKPVEKEVYDKKAAKGKDPYEMFLSGSDALLVVENPLAQTQRELIVFRDSFGSSLIPLLIEGYSKVTLVDIRYIQSGMLGNFIGFEDRDVLFLYSTLLLNNSLALK